LKGNKFLLHFKVKKTCIIVVLYLKKNLFFERLLKYNRTIGFLLPAAVSGGFLKGEKDEQSVKF